MKSWTFSLTALPLAASGCRVAALALAFSLILPGPGRAQNPEPSGWLSGASYFASPVADPREPRTGVAFFTTNLFYADGPPQERPPFDVPRESQATRERQAAAMLGGKFTVWQGRLTDDLGVLFGFQGGVNARFRLDTSANDLLGTDWTMALPVEARWGRWSARARILHWSAHLGDEIQELTGARRIKFTYEAVDLLAGFRPWRFLRVYGGGSAVLRSQTTDETITVDGEPLTDAGHVQLGAEGIWPAVPERGLAMIMGLDWKKEDRSGWRTQLSAVGGFEARRGDQMVRLLGRIFNGPSPLGQIFLSDELLYGVELSVRW
jgi:hypothetical protein